MSTKDEEIISLLARIRDEQREAREENLKSFSDLDKKVDLHIQKTEYELKRINDQDEIQNQLLDQHIAGVNTLRDIHLAHVEQNEKQFSKVDREIESLKEPAKWIRTTTKVLLWVSGLSAGIMGIVKFLSWLKVH